MGKNSFDLSSLSDDEIETLLTDLILEAYQRGGQIAINAIYKADEIFNQASIEQKAKASDLAQALTNNLGVKKAWDEKKLIANTLYNFFGSKDITVAMWSTNKERRVYLYRTSTRSNFYKGDEMAVLYYTGNATKPPLHLDVPLGTDNKEELKQILADLARKWVFLNLDIGTLL